MRGAGLRGVSAVVVAFNTDPAGLGDRLASLSDFAPIVVDNSVDADHRRELRAVAERTGATHVDMGGNAGVAVAQNAGMDAAARGGAARVILLDDDTAIERADVLALTDTLDRAQASDDRVAAVGPLLRDERTGESMWFARRGHRVRFVRGEEAASSAALDAAFLIASGALIDVAAYRAIGPFRDEYFIDHIDREWGLRGGTLGRRFLVDPAVVVAHRLGDDPEQVGEEFRYRHSSGLRLYYGTRNSLLLVRDVRLPLLDRALEAAFALYVASGQFAVAGGEGRRRIVAGLLDGLRNRRGPLPEVRSPMPAGRTTAPAPSGRRIEEARHR